jgi:hypothetical protein
VSSRRRDRSTRPLSIVKPPILDACPKRGAKILATDSMGRDSAGAYRRLIEGLRSGDRSLLGVPD